MVLNQNLEWFYEQNTITPAAGKTFVGDSFQFVSPVLHKEYYKSPRADFIAPLIFAIQDSFNFKIKEMDRVKFNMTVNNNKINIHPPHIDSLEEKYVSVVYYVHDCDGETTIYDKVLNNSHKQQFENGEFSHQCLNIIKSITPKRGTAVMFDSNRLHSASNPIIADRRVILNCVFKV